jgi:class 3 adenylate cyclase/pimeloyl-ACP methyl ester carboxylesterase
MGEGPIDLVLCSGLSSHLDMWWDVPAAARFFQGLASFSRLILFDPRGLGLSDPAPYSALSTWEDWTEDIRTVLDVVGSQRATIFAERDFTRPAMLFAATSPERTAALILSRPIARYPAAADYPEGQPPEAFEQFIQLVQSKWGTAELAALTVPSIAHDPASLGLLARTLRASCSPKRAAEHMRYWLQLDVRTYLPAIRVPTLVFMREASPLFPSALFRYVAEHIAGARQVALPGSDIVLFYSGAEIVLGEVEEFLTGARHHVEADRVLATVLFTDLVKSTERAAELGDRRYRELLEQHHAAVRRELARFGGKEMDSAGDGFFASFEGPARAIRCAVAMRDALSGMGLESRAGLHTGECERVDGKLGGMAVHIGARVCALAGAGQVLVTSTVKDLVTGSGIQFEDHGSHALKGVPGEWSVYAVGVGKQA